MKAIRTILFIIIYLCTIPKVHTQTFNANLANILQNKLDSMVTTFSYNTKGISASIYVPGQGTWRGVSGVNYTGFPLTKNMQLGLASNSKLFTAVTMLRLQEDNILNLNDSIKKWIPNYTNVNPNITIRQLLNHTSGISDPFFTTGLLDTIQKYPTKVYTPTEVLTWLGPKVYDPGVGYQYSNINYILAGMIAKSATGKEISTLIRDYILTPLHMDSTFSDYFETVNGTLSHRHHNMVDLDTVSRVALNSAGGPSGFIFSTSGDMSKWYQALMSNQVLTPNSFAQLTNFVSSGNYGLGIQRTVFYGRTTWGHAGSTVGYKTRMVYDTAMKVIVCGLANDDYSALDGIIITLYKLVLDNLPQQADRITGNANVCQGQNSVTYTVPTIPNATSYIWTLPNGATGTSSTNSITVNYGSTALSGNITVCGTSIYGNGLVSTLPITVNLLPSTPGTITGNAIVCQGKDSVFYTVPTIANAVNYVWTIPTGTSSVVNNNNLRLTISNTAVSGNITVKGTNGCGSGVVSTLPIIVNPLPANAGAINGITTVCQGTDSVIYIVNAITNATSYAWTLPNGVTGTSISNSIVAQFTKSAASGNITVKGINACGEGVASILAITVNALPYNADTISGADKVCQGQNGVSYSIQTVLNATNYVWTFPNGVTGTSNTNTIQLNFSKSALSGNITVVGNNACGFGLPSSKNISINPLPSKPDSIIGATNVCQGQSGMIYSTPITLNATSYIWTMPNGIIGTSNTNSITASFSKFATNGNIVVKGSNACGIGIETAQTITVNPLPSNPDSIVGLENVCQNQQEVTYNISTISNATNYLWTLPSGATGTSNSNTIKISFSKASVSGFISVKGNNQCGNSDSTKHTINIKPLPQDAGVITGLDSVCQGQSSVLYSTSTINYATSYVWTLANGMSGTSTSNSIAIDFTNTAVSGNMIVKGSNSCGIGTESAFAITVKPLPSKPTITQNGNVLHSSASIGNQWYNTIGMLSGAVMQDYQVIVTNEYYVRVTLLGCMSEPSNKINMTPAGIKEADAKLNVKMYPNPVANELHIELEGIKINKEFEVINSIGQTIDKGILNDQVIINTKSYSPGIYYVKYENEDGYEFKKFIKE